MNNKKKIVGTVSLRDLLVADKDEILEDLMEKDSDISTIINEKGLNLVNDDSLINKIIDNIQKLFCFLINSVYFCKRLF